MLHQVNIIDIIKMTSEFCGFPYERIRYYLELVIKCENDPFNISPEKLLINSPL